MTDETGNCTYGCCNCFYPDRETCLRLALCPGVCCSPVNLDCWSYKFQSDDKQLQKLSDLPWLRYSGSWLFENPLDTKWLIIRVVSFVCMFAFVIDSRIYTEVDLKGELWLIYWTQWANLVTLGYLGTAAMLTIHARYIRNLRQIDFFQVSDNDIKAAEFTRWLIPISQVLFFLSVPSLTITAFNYWVFVYPWAPGYYKNSWGAFHGVSMHLLSWMLLMVDFVCSFHRFYFKSSICVLYFGTVFTVWSLIHYASKIGNYDGNRYIYSSYDWKSPGTVMFYYLFSVLLGVLAVCICAVLKDVCFSKCIFRSKDQFKDEDENAPKNVDIEIL